MESKIVKHTEAENRVVVESGWKGNEVVGIECKVSVIQNKFWNSAVKKKKILPFATLWMDLENITPSEITPSEKDKCCMISLICGI